ncbi:CoA-transferase family III [Rhizodiscina lignyota]|uniref:CoA-transferase family III n=1 Tax=Rhizodiscina lignyota TaxID=1504668 RepID=A0A9P4IJK9_9PEZI|nr:CoA-transferase family III [Rhizodiscina lignyota]
MLKAAAAPCRDLKKGPLAGLRVLDLSRILAGPFCTQILADYGADVIKVEQPGLGDDTRHWKTRAEEKIWKSTSPMSFYFCSVNRNKRSLTLDLKKEKARKILYDLAKSADVVVENFLPGKADELGVGYEKLSEINPSLIYASICGYGSTGPYAKRAGYDAIAAAEGGLMHITGEPGRGPVRPGLGMTDMSTGLYTHGAIMAALRERDQTGRGQKIDASLFETQVSLLINVGLNWLNAGIEGQRWGAAHPSIVPYNTFETKDGWLTMGANNERQFRTLTERINRPDLLEDERFSSNPKRVENRAAMDEVMNAIMREKTTDEWCEILSGSGLAYGSVNSIERVFKHPQIEPRKMVDTVDSDLIDGGKLKMIGTPVKFSGSEFGTKAPAPSLGQHTSDVLTELGYSEDTIASFVDEKVV